MMVGWVLPHMSPSHSGAVALDQEACVNIHYLKNLMKGLCSQSGR